jgi:hypothetical protein
MSTQEFNYKKCYTNKKKMNLLNSELRCSHRRNKKHVAKEIKNPPVAPTQIGVLIKKV